MNVSADRDIVQHGMMRVWLVQRGRFKPEDTKIEGLDSLIDYDYMGAAEFEFGALHYALLHLLNNYEDIVALETEHFDIDTNGLSMFCLKDQEADALATIWKCAQNKYPFLKCHCGMWEHLTGGTLHGYGSDQTNFWWAFSGSDKGETFWMVCPSYEAPRLAQALKLSRLKLLPGSPQVPDIITPVTERIKPCITIELDTTQRSRREQRYKVVDAEGVRYSINPRIIKEVMVVSDAVVLKTARKTYAVKGYGHRLNWFASLMKDARV